MMLRDTPGVPVGIKIAERAWFAAPDPVVVNVQSPAVTPAVADPAMEDSTRAVTLSLTTVPQVLASVPVTGWARPSSVV